MATWTGRVAGVLAATTLLLGGCAVQETQLRALGARGGPTGPATQVITVDPYADAATVAGIAISLTANGDCQPSNKDAGNAGAYRCFIEQQDPDGGNIEDPCFARPAGTPDASLLCLTAPDARSAVKVIPNEAPERNSAKDADPWYVQLRDGAVCGLIGGATDEVDGQRLNYSCPDGSNLFGDPVRKTPLWTISRQAKDATAFTPAEITRAWM